MVIIRNSQGGKGKVQARHLTTTINEVHAMFKEENPAIKIRRNSLHLMERELLMVLVVQRKDKWGQLSGQERPW